MKKGILYSILAVLITVHFTSCDDNGNQDYQPPTIKPEERITPNQDSIDNANQGITTSLLLLDDEGRETTRFMFGGEIIFLLVFQNQSDTVKFIPKAEILIGEDLLKGKGITDFLKVRAADGTEMGYPIDYVTVYQSGLRMEPKQKVVWVASWLGSMVNWPFKRDTQRNYLPEGNYFCQFNLCLDKDNPEKLTTVRCDFEVYEDKW